MQCSMPLLFPVYHTTLHVNQHVRWGWQLPEQGLGPTRPNLGGAGFGLTFKLIGLGSSLPSKAQQTCWPVVAITGFLF